MPTKQSLDAANVNAGEVCAHLFDTLLDKINAAIVLVLGGAPLWHDAAKDISEYAAMTAPVVAVILGVIQIYATVYRLRRGKAAN